MSRGIGVVGLYVHDQDDALDFYVNKLGFQLHTDARNGDYRWLTVKHANQPTFELGLFLPQEPVLDAKTAQTMREMVAKGAMPPLVLVVEDCRAAYEKMRDKGVESRRSRSRDSAASTPISATPQATPGRWSRRAPDVRTVHEDRSEAGSRE